MKQLIFLLICAVSVIAAFAQNKQPKVIKYEAPTYPVAARATRTQGEVIVSVRIDRNGNVSSVSVESGHPLLRAVCEIASGNWKFSRIEEVKECEAKLIYSFKIKLNNSSKNNYKNDKITARFRKPNRVEITVIGYPRFNTLDLSGHFTNASF